MGRNRGPAGLAPPGCAGRPTQDAPTRPARVRCEPCAAPNRRLHPSTHGAAPGCRGSPDPAARPPPARSSAVCPAKGPPRKGPANSSRPSPVCPPWANRTEPTTPECRPWSILRPSEAPAHRVHSPREPPDDGRRRRWRSRHRRPPQALPAWPIDTDRPSQGACRNNSARANWTGSPNSRIRRSGPRGPGCPTGPPTPAPHRGRAWADLENRKSPQAASRPRPAAPRMPERPSRLHRSRRQGTSHSRAAPSGALRAFRSEPWTPKWHAFSQLSRTRRAPAPTQRLPSRASESARQRICPARDPWLLARCGLLSSSA